MAAEAEFMRVSLSVQLSDYDTSFLNLFRIHNSCNIDGINIATATTTTRGLLLNLLLVSVVSLLIGLFRADHTLA